MNAAVSLSEEARRLSDQLIAWRRHLHAHPELSFEEWQTADFIEGVLGRWLAIRTRRVHQTGVVADIVTDPAGPWVALRADIDALPIQEVARPHASQKANRMHACGHELLHFCMRTGLLGAGGFGASFSRVRRRRPVVLRF